MKEGVDLLPGGLDRALDEIETTLDAMTEAGQEDGKITPIWGAGTKKDR